MIASAPGSSIPSARRSRGSCSRSRSGGGRRPAPPARSPTASEIAAIRGGIVDRSRASGGTPPRRRAVASGSASPGAAAPRGRRRARGPRSGRGWRGWRASSSRRSVLALGRVRSWGMTPLPSSSSAERTEHSGGALRDAVVAGEVHAVDRERRRGVGDEHAVVAPRGERSRGRVVRVGEDQPHRVVGVARQSAARASGSITS